MLLQADCRGDSAELNRVQMNHNQKFVLTIGHSNHSIEVFVSLLRRHGVKVVADVRSVPFSRRNPHFCRKPLAVELRANDIEYIFLGRELGARPDDDSCYCGGRVQYDLLVKKFFFRRGIKRIMHGAENHRIALMCAEKEPLDCHRSILVGRRLVEQGATVGHILACGKLETNDESMDRLLEKVKLSQADLLQSKQELIEVALDFWGNQIAYTDERQSADASIESP